MKINNIKINGFGNLENKDFCFKNGINLISGNNENGKSTLLKFIISMLYGISKNKIKEQVRPWYSNDFSGKIDYTLDNGKTFSVFRDFGNKQIKILDDNSKDVTSDYGVDKSCGSLFFREQTGITKELFLSTYISRQGKSKLEVSEQENLVQTISNLMSTGDNNISFSKTIEKLNQKLIQDVGTDRTTGRPLNIIDEKIENLQKQKQELIHQIENKNEFEKEKYALEDGIKLEEQKLEVLKEIRQFNEDVNLEQEKIKINENARK